MIPFSPPRIDEQTIAKVSEVLRSSWITTGPHTKLFEQKIADYCGVEKVLCTSSATTAMEMLLKFWGVGPGDEVIVPAYTYCATANVVLNVGATPVMVDVNELDFNIDVSKIAKAITPKTKVIIPVDFAGFPCDYDELRDLIESPKLKEMFTPNSAHQKQLGRILLLADAAHSFGAIYYGTTSGSLADLTVFSFHAVKNLTTAEGGAICFNLPHPFEAEELYKSLNIMSLHGQSKDAFAKTQKGNWEYDVEEPGMKCNMTDIQAAIGLVELERYEAHLMHRKAIFDVYVAALQQYDWAELPAFEDPTKITSYHLFPLRIKGVNLAQRNAIIQDIFDCEVSVNVHFKPLPLLTAYKKRGYDIENYPVSKKLWEQEISLPVYFDLQLEQAQQVADAVIKSAEKIIHG